MSRFKFLKSMAKGNGLSSLVSRNAIIGLAVTGVVGAGAMVTVNANPEPETQMVINQTEEKQENQENFIDISEKYKLEKSKDEQKVAEKEEVPVVEQEQEEVPVVEEEIVEYTYEEPVEESVVYEEPVSAPIEEPVSNPTPEPVPPVEEAPVGPVFTYTSEVVVPEGLTSNDVLHGYINLVAIDSQGIDRSSEAMIYKGAPTPDGRVFFSFGVYLDGEMHQGKVFYTFQ